jgi:hypothetical protein
MAGPQYFHRSIFGPLSIGLPLLGLCAEAVLILYRADGPNPATTAILLSALGTFVLGIVFGIAGSMRGERMRQLPALGIGFNILLVAVHFLA